MRKGNPNQLIAELTRKIEELKSEEGIESSSVIIDKEDVIEADEVIEEFEEPEEEEPEFTTFEATPEIKEEIVEELVEEPELDHDEYLNNLYGDIENELAELVQGVSWNSDENNIYMDVSFSNDHLITFTIPKEDLIFDLENMYHDVNYICTAVREANPVEEVKEFLPAEEFESEVTNNSFMDEIYIDNTPPAYL